MNAFSTANLAVVAYALVKSDGTSPEMNSGVTTTKLGTGAYEITLPGKEAAQENLQQGQGNPSTGFRQDLILACATRGGPLMVSTNDMNEFVKSVFFADSRGAADSDFAFVILRSTLPVPTDSNGNQDGPV